MKRLLTGLVFLLALAGAAGLLQRYQEGELAKTRAAGVTALRDVALTIPTQKAVHDNGLACLAGVATVTPRDLGGFARSGGEPARALEAIASGQQSIETLAPAEQERFVKLAPWGEQLRECSRAARLALVEGLLPDQAPGAGHHQVADALDAWFRWQALELRTMTAEQAPNPLLLQRCTDALTLATYATHLGPERFGLEVVDAGLALLTPPCGAAVTAATAEERATAARLWAPLPERLAKRSVHVRWERFSSLSWPVTKAAPGESMLERVQRERRAQRWDDALAALEHVADGTPAERAPVVAQLLSQFSAEPAQGRARAVAQTFEAADRVEATLASWLALAGNP